MDSAKLLEAIVKAKMTVSEVAEKLGVSRQNLYQKADGEREFKASEVKRLADILNLTMEDVNAIFFGGSVN